MARSRTVLAVAALAAVLLTTWDPGPGARAADRREPQSTTPGQPPAPPPPYVVVTRIDKSQIKGHLVASDLETISVREPAPPTQAPNDPVVIPWTEVSKVSNGLTRQKVIDKWKVEQPDKLCETCKGQGVNTCETCKGTAHDPAALKGCKTCGGKLLVTCKAPGCREGKIRCPNRCIKPDDPGWITRADGSKFRRLKVKDNVQELTENNIGEIIVIKKLGEPPTLEPCPTCGKTGKLDCPTCKGAAKVPCPTCVANTTAPKCPDCEKGATPCKTCEGTGMKK